MREGQAIGIGVLVKGAVIFAIAAIAVIIFMSSGSSPFNDFAQEKWDTNSCLDLKTSCNIQKAQQRGCDWAQGSRKEARNQCPSGVSPANGPAGSGGESGSTVTLEVVSSSATSLGFSSQAQNIREGENRYLILAANKKPLGSQDWEGWNEVHSKECTSSSCSFDSDQSVDVGGKNGLLISALLTSSQDVVSSGSISRNPVITSANAVFAYRDEEGWYKVPRDSLPETSGG